VKAPRKPDAIYGQGADLIYFDLKKSEGRSRAAVLAAFSDPAGQVSWQGR